MLEVNKKFQTNKQTNFKFSLFKFMFYIFLKNVSKSKFSDTPGERDDVIGEKYFPTNFK